MSEPTADWHNSVLQTYRNLARATRTQLDPRNPSNWGLRENEIVRMGANGEPEPVPAADILEALSARKESAPEKSLVDRAYELLFHWIACNTRPYRIDDSEGDLPREAVRWCRSLEAEVAQATKRPEEKLRTARRQADDEEDLL